MITVPLSVMERFVLSVGYLFWFFGTAVQRSGPTVQANLYARDAR